MDGEGEGEGDGVARMSSHTEWGRGSGRMAYASSGFLFPQELDGGELHQLSPTHHRIVFHGGGGETTPDPRLLGRWTPGLQAQMKAGV